VSCVSWGWVERLRLAEAERILAMAFRRRVAGCEEAGRFLEGESEEVISWIMAGIGWLRPAGRAARRVRKPGLLEGTMALLEGGMGRQRGMREKSRQNREIHLLGYNLE